MNISWQKFCITPEDVKLLAELVAQNPAATLLIIKREYRDLSETIGSSTMYVDICGQCTDGCFVETPAGGWQYIDDYTYFNKL